MRFVSIVCSLLFLLLTVNSVSAQEPTAEELTEIAKIRAALGPEFHIASQAFGPDVPVSAGETAESPDVLVADSAADSFFSSLLPPSLERAAKFATLAQSDLQRLSAVPTDLPPAEAEELRQLEKECRELADRLHRLAKLRAKKATQLR